MARSSPLSGVVCVGKLVQAVGVGAMSVGWSSVNRSGIGVSSAHVADNIVEN